MAFILTQLGAEGVRDQIVAASNDVASTVLGQPGITAVQSGSAEMAALAVGGFVAIVGMGVVGLRALATASHRAR
jgi:threonine dehydrogenase-like Zn-dependent dehydrogenase